MGRWLLSGALVVAMTGLCQDSVDSGADSQRVRKITIFLSPENPALSYGVFSVPDLPDLKFKVGFGKHGIAKEGERFSGGHSLLGRFRVNAKLSADHFEMDSDLISKSGKSADYLKEKLFENMSSIDFDGDGNGGEYGAAFVGLEPLSEVEQPFHFGEYQGKFRWYSYAIHGTQDESRIGKMITGGCINVGAGALGELVKRVKIGDSVEVRLLR